MDSVYIIIIFIAILVLLMFFGGEEIGYPIQIISFTMILLLLECMFLKLFYFI